MRIPSYLVCVVLTEPLGLASRQGRHLSTMALTHISPRGFFTSVHFHATLPEHTGEKQVPSDLGNLTNNLTSRRYMILH